MNIETSAEARQQYQRLAANGVPVLLIAGDVVRGYNPKKIEMLLDAWQKNQDPAGATHQADQLKTD